jgi:hypothetical protein
MLLLPTVGIATLLLPARGLASELLGLMLPVVPSAIQGGGSVLLPPNLGVGVLLWGDERPWLFSLTRMLSAEAPPAAN